MPCAVIMTALEVEYLAVRAHLTDLQEEVHPRKTIYEKGKFATSGRTWDVGIVEIGERNSEAAAAAERAIAYFNPEIILFVGVAGGIQDKGVKVGDVVAATEVYNYESGKADETFQNRPKIGLATFDLVNRARAEKKRGDWLRILGNEPNKPIPTVFVKPIAAGEKVITSTKSDVYKLLRSNYEDAVAVEMEGFGFLTATYANQQVSAMVIRGISDLIDGKTASDQKGYQEIASRNASAFAFQILKKFVDEKLKIQRDKSDFIGRDDALRDIDRISQESKIIIVQAESGAGKTTLAKAYMKRENYKLLEINVGTWSESISSAEDVVDDLLREFNIPLVSEFNDKLLLLRKKLKAREHYQQKIGILINNLETLLDRDGRFMEEHHNYVEILKALADSSVKCLTIITSCCTLHYENIRNVIAYDLENLSLKVWKEFFDTPGIKQDPEALKKIYIAHNGNAFRMIRIRPRVLKDDNGDLNEYWRTVLENSSHIEESKASVESDFNHLKIKDFDAYRLLCRLGCYRYQSFPTLRKESLVSLLWDISKEVEEIDRIIKSLRDRSLISFKGNTYSLHPAFQTEAIRRLKLNRGEWKQVNIQVAEFYDENSRNINRSNQDRVNAAFESIYHYDRAGEFEKCYEILLRILEAEDNLENLRCSENLWLYPREIIEKCKDLTTNDELTGLSKLSGLSKAITLIPLGILYPEMGKTDEAVEASQNIKTITENMTAGESEKYKKIMFAKVASCLISGRANKFIGNFSAACQACEEAIGLVLSNHEYEIDSSTLNYWHSLAVYELGTVHLEKAKLIESPSDAWKALWYIKDAAFLAVGVTKTPLEFYRKIWKTGETSTKFKEWAIEFINLFWNRTENKKRDKKDYTKIFRVLHNAGRCLNVINFAPPFNQFNRFVLEEAQKKLRRKGDLLNETWSYLELALCSSPSEAEEYYRKAIEKENFSYLTTLCKAYVLLEYGNFKYNQNHYLEAINKYIDLKKFLERRGTEELEREQVGFGSLKIRNYCSLERAYENLNLDPAYENLSSEEREEIEHRIGNRVEYEIASDNICANIGMNLDDMYKAIDLKKSRSNSGKRDATQTI